jgi:hypothetical protein
MSMRMSIKNIVLIVLSILCLLWVGAGWAGAAQGPSVIRRVIGGGGRHLEQGIYTLDNTIGQPVVARDSRRSTDLCAGFWCREIRTYFLFLPLAVRDYGS